MKKIYLRYDDEFSKPIICNYGPSWLILLLGSFYFLIKKDYKYFFITLITQLAVIILLASFIHNVKICVILIIIMLLIINLLFALNYNFIIIEELLKNNYIPYDQESTAILMKKGIYFKIT